MSSLAVNGFTLTHASLHATQGISPIERLILATLSSFANFLSECWPSNQTLADRTGLHERTVGKAIGKLQEKGLIERKSRGQGRAMLTRILIPLTPPAQSLPPPAHGLPEPARNLLQIPIAATEPATLEPQHQQATDTAIIVFTANEQPPQALTKEIPDVLAIDCLVPVSEVTGCHSQAGMPVEARTALQEPSQEVPATDTLADVPAQAVEADPLAEVPATLLADLGEVRKAKKRAPKPTKTEVQHWYSEALKAGWTMKNLITLMVLRGWASFGNALWLENIPQHTITSPAPAAPKLWTPDQNHTPASPGTLAQMREKIAAMKARWKEEPLNTPPPIRR